MSISHDEHIQQYTEILEAFCNLFEQYSNEVFGTRERQSLDKLRRQLQRDEPKVTAIILEVLGEGTFSLGPGRHISRTDLLQTALMGANNEMPLNFRDFHAAVNSCLERALGTLKAGLWPPNKPTPVLLIKDSELRERCYDLLSAPNSYDRVLREATLILEDRIRRKVPHEVLAKLIPNSADQSGNKLINLLFSVDTPVLVISAERLKRVQLREMLVGVVSYLRNPSHHQLDAWIEWSWAWSAAGLIDRLLLDIESCTLNPIYVSG